MAKKEKPRLTRSAVVSDAKNVVLGETYTDSVTGIKGVAIIVYVHLTGCDQVCLEHMSKDGDKPLFHTVDASRLVELEQVASPRPGAGGPGTRPTRSGH